MLNLYISKKEVTMIYWVIVKKNLMKKGKNG